MGRVLQLTALGVLLVAVTFSVLALNVSWGKSDLELQGQDVAFGFRPLSFSASSDGDTSRLPYSNDDMDDTDGIGQIRAGGVLWLIGTILAGLALLLAEHRVLLQHKAWTWAGAAVGLVSSGLLITGLVLLPIGIGNAAPVVLEPFDGPDPTWVFGLYAGIVAAALVLAATAILAIQALREGGFHLEPAEGEPASFD